MNIQIIKLTNEYGKGNYETLEARYKYACAEAQRLGIEAGRSELIAEFETCR